MDTVAVEAYGMAASKADASVLKPRTMSSEANAGVAKMTPSTGIDDPLSRDSSYGDAADLMDFARIAVTRRPYRTLTPEARMRDTSASTRMLNPPCNVTKVVWGGLWPSRNF